MAKNSIIEYTGDGSTIQYAINFTGGYTSEDHVYCQVNNEVDGSGDPVYRTLTFISEGLVDIGGTVPGLGEPIEFKRITPVDTPVVDFEDGVVFTEADIDAGFQQVLFGVQEAQDNFEDAAATEEAKDAAEAARTAAEIAQAGAQAAQAEAELAYANALAISTISHTDVSSIAELKALNSSDISVATLTDPTALGTFVLLSGDYSALATLDPLNGISAVPDDSVATSKIWVRIGYQNAPVIVDWFGATGDGSTDDSVAIQAAINTGFDVMLLGKSYVATNLVMTTDNQKLSGVGPETRLLDNSTTANLFTVGNGTDSIYRVILRDFTVWCNTGITKTSGYVAQMRFANSCELHNVNMGTLVDYTNAGNSTPLYHGVFWDRFYRCREVNCMHIVSQTGTLMHGDTDQTDGAEIHIGGSSEYIYCEKGVHIGGACGGVYLEEMEVSICDYGLWIDDTLTGAINREIFITGQSIWDNCRYWGMYIEGDAFAIIEGTPWANSNGTATNGGANGGGIYVTESSTTQGNINFSGGQTNKNQGDGIRLRAGIVDLVGVESRTNGLGTDGGTGVIAETDDVQLKIIGGKMDNNGNSTRGSNIAISATTPSVYYISGVDVRSPGVTGSEIFVATAYAKSESYLIENCIGFLADNSGTVSGTTDGAGDIAVVHGLGTTVKSAVASIESLTAAGYINIHDKNATSFKVRLFDPNTGTVRTSVALTVSWNGTI